MEVRHTLGVWLEDESILRKLPRASEITTVRDLDEKWPLKKEIQVPF